MADPNPWSRWGLIYTLRDGLPALTETALWQLAGEHPEAVERAGPSEVFLHLDRTYRLLRLPDRSFCLLEPAPERSRGAR